MHQKDTLLKIIFKIRLNYSGYTNNPNSFGQKANIVVLTSKFEGLTLICLLEAQLLRNGTGLVNYSVGYPTGT